MILTGEQRVIQVHPTLRCNLRCLHCYSTSGPDRDEHVPVELLVDAMADAAACGYQVVAVSGGEPLLYRGLPTLLDAARDAGLSTAITTNGTLLTPTRLADLGPRLDLLAISLDGVPDTHDRVRNRRGCFATMARNLDAVQASGVRFGFIFTLTQHNVHELDWVARFAADRGAALLQIHPLELVGRAAQGMRAAHPDVVELGFAFAEMLRLKTTMHGRMDVHLDVASRPALHAMAAEARARAASDQASDGASIHLADVVSPLVVEADGTVVPLTFAFPRGFALGDIRARPLRELAQDWLRDKRGAYEAMLVHLLDDEVWSRQLPLINVYETAAELAAS